MNIDKKLNEMKPKDTPLLVLGYIILGMFLLIPMTANADNIILIDQAGDNLTLTVTQDGYNNVIQGIDINSQLLGASNNLTFYQQGYSHLFEGNLDGSNNTFDLFQGNGGNNNFAKVDANGSNNDLKVWQGKHLTGNLDIDEEGGHEAYWTIDGSNNTLASSQTDTNRSSGGANAGPHHLANIITGDYNDVDHRQLGKSGHDGFIEITGDYNDVVLYQRGNGGVKWADIVLDGDGHSVDVNQRGGHNATATIDLTYGTGAYTLDLDQNMTSSAGTYSITGVCYNTAGCSVTVNGSN
jgi:hypothetical protein